MPSQPRDDGLSEVVGFVLILGLIVVALSLYQLYGVPAAGRENEIAHMNAVKDRFVDYKIALDSLWVNRRDGVLLSTAFDLGTDSAATGGKAFAFPILSPAGSGGTVSVQSGGAYLTIEPAGKEPVTIPLGSLTYRSSNRYWVDQTWTYQMGAVFLSQDGGTTVRVGPSIAAAKTANDNIALSVVPIRLDGSATVAGSGPVRIETRMRWSSPSSLDGEYDQASLTIEAGDPVTAGAWERAFGEVRQRAQSEGVNPLWLPIERVGNTVTLSIQPPTDKKVVLSVYPASYTATVRNAASLME
jgi:hypothetical protein